MPIHDQSYRHYTGRREPQGRAWIVIALAGIRNIIRKRLFIGLLLMAWIPFVVYAVQFYLAATIPQASAFLAPTPERFRGFFEWQGLFVFFITVWVGAGLIANDRRANALQIYLSKPLARSEYVAGKLMILVSFLLLVTWIPGILLLVLQVAFAGSFSFVRANPFVIPAITLYSFLQVLVASFTMLALSSLSKSGRYVAILYAGAALFSHAVFGVVSLVTHSTSLSWISFLASLSQVGDVVFRLRPHYATPWPVSVLAILALIAVSILILDRRVRGVEVVR